MILLADKDEMEVPMKSLSYFLVVHHKYMVASSKSAGYEVGTKTVVRDAT